MYTLATTHNRYYREHTGDSRHFRRFVYLTAAVSQSLKLRVRGSEFPVLVITALDALAPGEMARSRWQAARITDEVGEQLVRQCLQSSGYVHITVASELRPL